MASWLLAVVLCAAVGGDSDCTIVYFTASWCQPCQQVRPSLQRLSQEGWDVREVDADQHGHIVQKYQVRNLPTIVLLSGGQEVDRLVGAIPYEQIRKRAERVAARSEAMISLASQPVDAAAETQTHATPASAALQQPIARGQSPATAGGFPMLASVANAARNVAASPVATASDRHPANPGTHLTAEQAIERASQATVRIRVDEANTTAYGTGTIVDVHGEEALVLTCGHLFRDMNPNSQLTLDLFPGTPREINVPSQLIDFKAEEEDIGLISFRLPVAVEPVDIIPRGEKLEIGQPAFSFGCDHGADPTRRDTKVKDINRFVGAANVEIFGAPAVGRSGGGLFDRQGRLIGVCNAADAADDQGIYAAAEVVYMQLERLGMEHLFEDRQADAGITPSAANASLAAHSDRASTSSSLASSSLANSAPANSSPANDRATPAWPDESLMVPESVPPSAKASVGTSSIDSAPQIICIVRGSGGQDRVITIDGPSPTLLEQIMSHRN